MDDFWSRFNQGCIRATGLLRQVARRWGTVAGDVCGRRGHTYHGPSAGRLADWKKAWLAPGVLLVCSLAPAWGRTADHISRTALANLHLPHVVLQKVTKVIPKRAKNRPARTYVDVAGIIDSRIRFELLLPQKWNGCMTMGGGGGFVGSVQNQAANSVYRGFATVGTDTGHESRSGFQARWAYHNHQAKVDFGYLAVHRTAQVAKALIHDYYMRSPRYCYFIGCSRGGGQAMMEAQRYPQDFNGIVAGAPAFNWTGFAATMVAIAKALYPNPRHLHHSVLTQQALKALQAGILQQAAAQGELQDGVIANPLAVHLDLAKVRGLTAAQRQAIAAIGAGAHNGRRLIYPGYTLSAGCFPGQWTFWFTGPVPGLLGKYHAPDATFIFGAQIFKYLVFNDLHWNYAAFRFAHFRQETRRAAHILNATNPDMRSFKARGGKLIIWQGWADPALPPLATVHYYQNVLAHDPQARAFCRLYMIPGCLHCGGGPGPSHVNWLAVISKWVEHGQAPGRIIASKYHNGKVVATRPLYPYPDWAAYQGHGNPANATSYIKRAPGH